MERKPNVPCIQTLLKKLHPLAPGPVDDGSGEIKVLLAKAWDEFIGGNQTKMATCKVSRAEKLCWNPPILSFQMERHGATVMGSTRAEIQRWEVNLETLEASCDTVGRRQLVPMDKRLDTAKLAAEIASLVTSNREDERLKWLSTDKVRVKISEVIPETYVETTISRRKRFRKQLAAELAKQGWEPVLHTIPNTYQRH